MAKTDPPFTESALRNELRRRGQNRRHSLAKLAGVGAAVRVPRNDISPRLEIVNIAPEEIPVPGRNVRKHEEDHVREVAGSIRAFGFCIPVLIGKDNVVIDGVVRVEAAKQAGMDRIPCVRIDHLSANEQRLLRISVNRLNEKGRWDLGELKLEFEELIKTEVPIEISGFSPDEIDAIRFDDIDDSVEQGPLKPQPGAIAVAQPSDVFVLGPHRFACGDARDAETLRRLLSDDAPARLLLTDEPFNIPMSGLITTGAHRNFATAGGEMTDEQFLAFNVAWLEASLPYLCDGAIVGSFIDWRHIDAVTTAAKGLGLSAISFVVWVKTNAGLGGLYRSQHELLPLFKKGSGMHVNNIQFGKRGRWRSNVWTYPGASSLGSDSRRGLEDHPTVKPCLMLQDALIDLTNSGDIVFDPFLGSGSTLIAANRTGRICRGVEIDPLYCDVIIRRYGAETGGKVLLQSTGEDFETLAERRRQERMNKQGDQRVKRGKGLGQ